MMRLPLKPAPACSRYRMPTQIAPFRARFGDSQTASDAGECIEILDVVDCQHDRVSARVILEALFYWFSALAQAIDDEPHLWNELNGRLDDEMVSELQRQMRIVGWTHDFVQLFAGPDANDLVRKI